MSTESHLLQLNKEKVKLIGKKRKALHSKECSPQHQKGENCPCPKMQKGIYKLLRRPKNQGDFPNGYAQKPGDFLEIGLHLFYKLFNQMLILYIGLLLVL